MANDSKKLDGVIASPPATCYDSLREIEDKVLREANDEFFKLRTAFGHRITREQAICVIKAWVKNVIPHLDDES